jgi:hypothetical protein
VKITAAANETFAAWREGAHDDLVLAVALACWHADRAPALPFSWYRTNEIFRDQVLGSADYDYQEDSINAHKD